jgi:hypothetical protein
VVATVALGSALMICLTLSISDSDSEPTSDSCAFTLATNDYFERQSTVLCQGLLGSHTISRYLFLSFRCPCFLAACTSCPEVVRLCSVLFSMGWGHPFLDFFVRGSQDQIVSSFVLASARF